MEFGADVCRWAQLAGWSVANLASQTSHGIWRRCLPWGVDVQDTLFNSGRKCVAMVTAYYGGGGKWGKILRRKLFILNCLSINNQYILQWY